MLSTFLSHSLGLLLMGNMVLDPVEFDRGSDGDIRLFKSAEACVEMPCVLTEHGAIRISKTLASRSRIEIGNIHRDSYRTVGYFQQSTTFEQKISERILNRKPHRKVVDLSRMIEVGSTSTIYIYGILLQYELDEADLIILKLTDIKDPTKVRQYYFRYHHDAFKFDIDIAFVQPINVFTPNPSDRVQAAYSTAALSFSIAKAMDPEKDYSFLSKMLRAVRINLFTGLLLRKEIQDYHGDKITSDHFDCFAGLGLTFFNFFAVGYGANIIRSPHTTFPFIGLEFRHLMGFLQGLKQDTHTRWTSYLHDEDQKSH